MDLSKERHLYYLKSYIFELQKTVATLEYLPTPRVPTSFAIAE